MKRKKIKILLAIIMTLVISASMVLMVACDNTGKTDNSPYDGFNGDQTVPGGSTSDPTSGSEPTSSSSDKDDDYAYAEDLVTSVTVTCVSGTEGICTETENSDGTTTLTFGKITEETTYSISGTLNGNIIIDVDEDEDLDFELSLEGLVIQSETAVPILILSGDKVSITAKKDTENYIYDKRPEVSEDDYSGCIYSVVDLKIKGKGSLWITSENNNGIHTKDDLEVKNLTLYVKCVNNALKGNDSVTIEGSPDITLIATAGNGIRTSNSSVSSKGNQKGTVTITGGTIRIYAACDGIDSEYDVNISEADGCTTYMEIYTDKYSEYSEEVTSVSDGIYYIRSTSTAYKYSIRYYSSSSDSEKWVNSTSYKTVSAGGGPGRSSTYYYYTMEKPSGYDQMEIYVYASSQTQGQSESYYSKVTGSVNDNYDTLAYNGSSFSWTNYTTQQGPGGPGGMGGMDQGNTDKGDYSTKGIKADNSITISAGTVKISSYDDAIHANNDVALENGASPLGSVTVSGGTLTLYSNDDGIHADGTLTVNGGNISIKKSYEGLEGGVIVINGGTTSVIASDDGLNGTNTTGTDLYIKNGYLYVYAGGDGLDANSTTQYAGISFEGGNVVVISTSGGNSCIDTERGYTYAGGTILAMCPTGMTNECEMCSNFSSVAVKTTKSVSSGTYVTVGSEVAVKVPASINNCYIVYLSGSSSKTISTSSSVNCSLDNNNVYWG